MEELFKGILLFKWQYIVMYIIGGVLIYLAIKKDYEPMLLLPIGFGAILVNIPLQSIWQYEPELDQTVTQIVMQYPVLQGFFEENLHYIFEQGQAFKVEPGVLQLFYNSGILTEIFPVLIFVAVGAMCDFTPLLKNPRMIFFGAAAQFGIFFTMLAVLFIGYLGVESFQDLKLAASIGIIGAADGPTSIFVASKFAREWLGPISVAAYSYMSLVPIIQPPVIKALTTKKERMIRMEYTDGCLDEETCSGSICDVFVAKLNGDGDAQWIRQVGNGKNSYRSTITGGLAVDNGGNIYFTYGLTGSALSPTRNYRWSVAKYDNDGNYIWSTPLYSIVVNALTLPDIAVDSWGNIFTYGVYETINPITRKSENQCYLNKFDSQGNQLLVKSFSFNT